MKSRVIAGVALCGTVGLAAMIGGTVAEAAPTSGAIKVWVKPTHTAGTTTLKHPGTVMITGAIGDYGTSLSENARGKAVKKGPFKLLRLHKGTAPITIVKGTGAYTGITGSVTFTVSYGLILPKKKSGACTEKTSTKPLATFTSFSGTGTVTLP
jgi:hypothetical protein